MSEPTQAGNPLVEMLLALGFVQTGNDPQQLSHPDEPGLAATYDTRSDELRVSPGAKERLVKAIREIDCSSEQEPHWKDSAEKHLGAIVQAVLDLPELT